MLEVSTAGASPFTSTVSLALATFIEKFCSMLLLTGRGSPFTTCLDIEGALTSIR
jgi:hypothetical protein